MLVLSRKVGEKLVIGDNIVVEVIRIRGNRITLGLVAPEEVKIIRGELKREEAKTQLAKQEVASSKAGEPWLKAC